MKSSKHLGVFLLTLFIISTLVIKSFDHALQNKTCPKGIVSFELAQTAGDAESILNSWDTQARTYAGLSLGFDFLYIFVYTGFLIWLIIMLHKKLPANKRMHNLQKIIIFTIIIAGIADVIENVSLINLLTGNFKEILVTTAYFSALIKFSILLFVIIYIIINSIKLLIIKK